MTTYWLTQNPKRILVASVFSVDTPNGNSSGNMGFPMKFSPWQEGIQGQLISMAFTIWLFVT
jgi:hypothetical protein